LQIDEDEIEPWVIKSIKHGLIQSKVDEYEGRVYVSGTSKVWVDIHYEEHLKEEVEVLRKNLNEILGKLD